MPVQDKHITPTQTVYSGLEDAYEFFNQTFFNGELPPCLITMQRQKGSYGYFSAARFRHRTGKNHTDEIALNPSHFRYQSPEEVLATLLHNMVHLWQHHHGIPSRAGYHNAEWAAKMIEVGLIPSDTGEPEGNTVGQKMGHYAPDDSPFLTACAEVIAQGFTLPYVEMDEPKAKTPPRPKYTCPKCALNVWGKAKIKIICGKCGEAMHTVKIEV